MSNPLDESRDLGDAILHLWEQLTTPPAPGSIWQTLRTLLEEEATFDHVAEIKNPPHWGCTRHCPRTDGVVITTQLIPASGDDDLDTQAREERNHSIGIIVVSDHATDFTPIFLEIEAAKKLVNTIGGAIKRVEERI